MMVELIESHHRNTEIGAKTVVADSKYGTIENYLGCWDRGIRAHIPDLKDALSNSGARGGIFSDDMFIYDKETDRYTCPAGKKLKPNSLHMSRQSIDYAALWTDCRVCELRAQCTRSKAGRTVKRHLRQEEINYMRNIAKSTLSKKDIKTRQHLMERSFARSVRYGFGRARWRGLWRVRIQEYLTAAIQNIQILMKFGIDPRRAVLVSKAKERVQAKVSRLYKNTERFLLESVSRLRVEFKVSFVFSEG
jgi:hypothetical protein